MTATPAPALTVTTVTAPDGTSIAVQVSGAGRPLVLVHGTSSDAATWYRVRPLLAGQVAVHAVDRRGRGESSDGPDYSIDREGDDLAAVVEAAADAWGGPVDVVGHSFGGTVALAACAVTAAVRRLVLYEGWPPPDPAHRAVDRDLLGRLDALLAAGLREEALEAFYRDLVHLTETEITYLRGLPTWPDRVAAAGTVPRELGAFAADAFDPAALARVAVPVLLVVGAESPPEILADPDVVAAALPDARVVVLPGQAHLAHLTDPRGFADAVLAFLG